MAETIDNSLKQPSKKGTGFTNIQRVMGANVGNRLGSTIGQGVQQVGQQARSGVQQSVGQFQQQSEQNRIGTAQDQQLMGQVLGAPTDVNAQQRSRFQQLLTGQYKGPKELADEQKLASQAQQAQMLGQASQTAGGRVELLRRFARPDQASYTQGKQMMDNLLLSQQQADLQAARRATQGLEGYTDAQAGGARGLFQQMTSDASRVGQESQQQFGQTVDDFYGQLEADRVAAEQARAGKLEQMRKGYSSGQMSQEDIDRFNLQGLMGQHLYNVDIGKHLTEADDQATLKNVASTDQMARLNALQSLGGSVVNPDVQGQLGLFQGMTPEEAQSYQKAAGYDFNASGFQRALTEGKKHADAAWIEERPEVHVFWEANDAIGKHIPDEQVREQAIQAAMRGDFSIASRYGSGAINAARNVAQTRPVLEAEYNRRRGSTTFGATPQVQTGPTQTGNIV